MSLVGFRYKGVEYIPAPLMQFFITCAALKSRQRGGYDVQTVRRQIRRQFHTAAVKKYDDPETAADEAAELREKERVEEELEEQLQEALAKKGEEGETMETS